MNLTEYEALQPNLVYEIRQTLAGEGIEGDKPINFDKMTEKLEAKTITFLTPNSQCAWRVNTLDTKEPDTIAWLAKMKPGETLFDVGANMGQYALIAAKKGLHVHAFEPESQNFALLCRNIAINKLGENVTAWPLALSHESGFDYFYAQSVQVGGSCSSYSEAVNFHLQPKIYAVRQGCSAITMDEFADKFGFPTHVKIDVDGLEHKVICGMGAVLAVVESVLVELNTALKEHMRIYEIMEDYGLYPDVATADSARRKDGAFVGIGNVIFYRRKGV